MAKEKDSMVPKEIEIKDSIFSIDCHPALDQIAIGLITGPVLLYPYGGEEPPRPSCRLKHHKQSCRALKFSQDGNSLYTGSKDRNLCQVDIQSGSVVHKVNQSHKSPIYSLHVVNTNTITTGDDSGIVKVWDVRNMAPVMEVSVHSDFISDMTDNGHKMLITVSGDGSMSATDLRGHKTKDGKSDTFESELLSVAIVKNGSKVICGDGDGAIGIFNWNLWEDITDRFPAHPQSIDCIVKITEDVVCTACMDGMIRAVKILPNKIILDVGQHSKELSADHLSLTHDHEYIASCSHDSVKFWSVDNVIQARLKSDPLLLRGEEENTDDDDDDDDDDDSGDEGSSRKRRKRKRNTVVSKKQKSNFFADLYS